MSVGAIVVGVVLLVATMPCWFRDGGSGIMSAVIYEPEIIEQFASDLYAQARNTEFSYSLFGLLITAGVGYYLSDDLGVITWGCALAGAVAGFLVGRSKAFLLRLQAQTALCQVEIEKNTRGTA